MAYGIYIYMNILLYNTQSIYPFDIVSFKNVEIKKNKYIFLFVTNNSSTDKRNQMWKIWTSKENCNILFWKLASYKKQISLT